MFEKYSRIVTVNYYLYFKYCLLREDYDIPRMARSRVAAI